MTAMIVFGGLGMSNLRFSDVWILRSNANLALVSTLHFCGDYNQFQGITTPPLPYPISSHDLVGLD